MRDLFSAQAQRLDGLSSVLEEARNQALRTNRRVLATWTVPWRSAAPSPFAFDDYVVWEQPERGFSLLALGQTRRIEAAGPGRFVHARAELDAVLGECVSRDFDEACALVPVCVAGFAFSDALESAEWNSFPAALAVIPRFVFMTRGDERYLRVSLIVDESTNPAAVASEAAQDLSPCQPALARALPDETEIETSTDIADARAAWNANVRSLTATIDAGEVEKVVLARRQELKATRPFHVASVMDRLGERYPTCTIFDVKNGGAHFIGATPELLVQLKDGRVRADCLAGSAARGENESEDDAIGAALVSDEKERREHAMVTRELAAALGAVCSELDVPATPRLRKMANVQHLHTPIEGRTDGHRHVLELIERLHPTPATGGLPRERALCLIAQHETFDRGWYAGPIGWIDAQGGGEFAVALRSALVEDRRAFLYAGCGIVSGSDPEREYRESQMKLEAMLWALTGKR